MTATTQAPATAPGSTAHTDGAWAVIPVQTRSERPRSFDPADFEVPNGREVNWKHTPVDRIAPLFEDAAADGLGDRLRRRRARGRRGRRAARGGVAPRRGLRARGPRGGDRVDALRRGAVRARPRRRRARRADRRDDDRRRTRPAGERAHRARGGRQLPRHDPAPPRGLRAVRAERRDHRARRRPPRGRHGAAVGRRRRARGIPSGPRRRATRRSATSSSASAAASCG